MTIKITLPTTFTGAAADTLPQLIHALPGPAPVHRFVSSLSGVAVGSPVGSLRNHGSMAGYAEQADTTARPLVATDTARGDYLSFDGVNDSLVLPTSSKPKSYVAVARYRGTPASGSNWPIVQIKNSAGAAFTALQRASNGCMVMYGGTGYVSTLNPGTTWHVFVAVYDPAAGVIRMDDLAEQAATTATIAAGAGASLTLGGAVGSGTAAQVDLAELVTYDEVLTAQQRADLVTTLRTVYGI